MRAARRGVTAGVAATVVIASVVGGGCSSIDGESSAQRAQSTSVAPANGAPALTASGPARGTLHIAAGPRNTLTFSPSRFEARTGIYRIEIDVRTGGHAFAFLSQDVRFAPVVLSAAGARASGRAFFGRSGDYRFACLVPGHHGMSGVVHVTGPPLTIEQATAEAAASGS